MEEKFFGIAPYGATPTRLQLQHLKMGKKAFFHFGVNTFSDKEWGDGTETERLFNPTNANVRGWIRDIKEAGFELAIITAKHHDGFCLWPSKYTEHSIKKSPYKNGKGDIIREFTDACHEFNVKVGIYISPWDRNSKLWGKDEYSFYYANQLEELLTQYGKLDEIWWDGAGSRETRYDWGLWAYMIKKHQPEALIFGSMGATPYVSLRWVGNESGFAGKTHYASIDAETVSLEISNEMNVGKIGGDRYLPAEVDVSIRPGWFYHEGQDDMVKSSRRLDDIWFRSVGNNAMMLLNFPPDRTGNIVRRDILNAIESNKRIKKMLSVNLLDGASVSADSKYCLESGICKARISDDELFYASANDRKDAVIDITLSDDSPAFNTLILGEKVELGERITSFKLESLDSGEPKILYTGTSVGYLRAVTFDKGEYKRLRLSVEGVEAPVTLRALSLNLYDEDDKVEVSLSGLKNLAALDTAQTVISEDGKSVDILFGGIYPFDSVSFNAYWQGGSYKIYAFDGSKHYLIAEGVAEDKLVTVKLETPVTSSYQVRIEYSYGFSTEPDFKVQ